MDSNEPAAVALSRILTLLRHTWVQDFIFPRQSQPDLLHLAITSAQASPHPSTGVMQIATLPTLRPEHSLDEAMRVLFVPSFTTGDITVGFQIFERIKTNTVNTSRFYLSRTVRDDVNGMFLSISEHPSLGTFELSYGTQVSACSREHAMMLFQSGPFLKAVNSAPVNFEGLQQALVYSFYSIEQKPCTVCPTKQGTCSCMIRTRRKRTCNDFDIENHNMESYCGVFDGVANISAFWNGCRVFHGDACSRVVAKIFKDDGLGLRLAQWGMNAICSGFRRMEVHPVVRSEMFGKGFCVEGFSFDGGRMLDWILNDGDLPLLADADEDVRDKQDFIREQDVERICGGVRIAPAGVVVDQDRPEGIDDGAWKKELKKRRNRAAAHRSNERKKRELEMMKREIEEFGRRANMLKEREEQLMKENKGLWVAVMQTL